MMKRLINKFIKILVELSYWNAFYMNNRKDKDVVFGLGVFAMTVMIFVNTLTILMAIQMYTGWKAADAFNSIVPEYIVQSSGNRWKLMYYAAPFFLTFTAILMRIMFRTVKRENVIKFFKNMSPKRRTKGKRMFFTYMAISFFFEFLVVYQWTHDGTEQEVLKHHYTIKELGPMPKFGDSIHGAYTVGDDNNSSK